MRNSKGLTIIEILMAVGLLGIVVLAMNKQLLQVLNLEKDAMSFEQEIAESRNLFHLLTTYWSHRVDMHNSNNIAFNTCVSSWCSDISFPTKKKVGPQKTFRIQSGCLSISSLPGIFNKLSFKPNEIKKTNFCPTDQVPFLNITITGSSSRTFPVVSASTNLSPFASYIDFKLDGENLMIRFQTWSHAGKKRVIRKDREISLGLSSWAGSGIIINPI